MKRKRKHRKDYYISSEVETGEVRKPRRPFLEKIGGIDEFISTVLAFCVLVIPMVLYIPHAFNEHGVEGIICPIVYVAMVSFEFIIYMWEIICSD